MDRLPHVLEAQQFDIDLMDAIFSTAREMEQVVQHYGSNILSRRVMATLFYEPSTRTRLSFESAMTRLRILPAGPSGNSVRNSKRLGCL